MKTTLYLIASLLLVAPAVAGENCKITDVKTSSLDAKAIGLTAESAEVLIATVTVATERAEPVILRWEDTVPTIKTEKAEVKASRLLIPNWLPMAGGVGPYATEMGVGGDEIGGWAKIDEKTGAGWLAVDKPGGTTGDHISIPVGKVTVTVSKEKPLVLKFLFAESPSHAKAVLTIPGCAPSHYELSMPSPAKAQAAEARPRSPSVQAQPEREDWWTEFVPSSGLVPAEQNPDFDKYMSISAPMRKGKDGKFVVDEVKAKGWDKTLKTFYMTLQIKPENPVRVGLPNIPATLPARSLSSKSGEGEAAQSFHSDCKALSVVEGRVLEATGNVGLAVESMGGTMGYIVGLPGSRLDVTAFSSTAFPLAGREWRGTSEEPAYIIVGTDEIGLVNVVEVKRKEKK